MPGPQTPKTFEEWLATLEDGVQFFEAWKDQGLGAANELAVMDGASVAAGLEIVTDNDAYYKKALKIPNLQDGHLAVALTPAAEDIELLLRVRCDAVLSEQEDVTDAAGVVTSRTTRPDRVYVGLGSLLQAGTADALLGAGLSMTNRGASCICGPACRLGPTHAAFRPATGAKVRQTMRGVSREDGDVAFVQRAQLEHEAAVSGEPVFITGGQCDEDGQSAVGNTADYHYMRLRVTRTAVDKATVELGWFEEKDVYTVTGDSTQTRWISQTVKDVPVPEEDGFGGLLLIAREDNVGNSYIDWISGSIDPDNFPAPFPPIAKTANCPLPPGTEEQPYEEALDPLGDFQGEGCTGPEAGEDTGLPAGLLYVFAERGMAGAGGGLTDPRQGLGGRSTMGYGNQERRSGGRGAIGTLGGGGGASGAPGASGQGAPEAGGGSTPLGSKVWPLVEAEGCGPTTHTVEYAQLLAHGAENLADPDNPAYWGGISFQTVPARVAGEPVKYCPVPVGSEAGVIVASMSSPPTCQTTLQVDFYEFGETFIPYAHSPAHHPQQDVPAGTMYGRGPHVATWPSVSPPEGVEYPVGAHFAGPQWGSSGGPSLSYGGGGAGKPPGDTGYSVVEADLYSVVATDPDAVAAGNHPVGVGGLGAVVFTYNAIWADGDLVSEVFRPGLWDGDDEFVFDCEANITPGTPLIIECWGGGGSGGVGVGSFHGDGGGGGAYSRSVFNGITDEQLTVHIGGGGFASWDGSSWTPQNGGDSWVQEINGAMAPDFVPAEDCDGWIWEVEGLPPGLNVNASTGVVSGTPAPGSAGTYELEITVRNATYKSQRKVCPFLIFRATDSRTGKARGGGHDLLIYGTENGRINVPDAVQDFTSDASMETGVVCAVRSKAYAPLGTDGEMVLRRLYIEGVHRQAASFWVLPIIDGELRRELRARVQLPAPPSGSSSRFHRWVPIYREDAAGGFMNGVRCSVATVYIETTDPVDEVNLQAAAWAHEPLDVARMRRVGEGEGSEGAVAAP